MCIVTALLVMSVAFFFMLAWLSWEVKEIISDCRLTENKSMEGNRTEISAEAWLYRVYWVKRQLNALKSSSTEHRLICVKEAKE